MGRLPPGSARSALGQCSLRRLRSGSSFLPWYDSAGSPRMEWRCPSGTCCRPSMPLLAHALT
eukprot:10997464-Alexandrium_andersonii.AAC.1